MFAHSSYVTSIDGSFSVKHEIAGIGGLIKTGHYHRLFVFSGPSSHSNCLNSELEALEILISHWCQLSFKSNQFVIRTDSKTIVDECDHYSTLRIEDSMVGRMLQSHIVRMEEVNFKIIFIPRKYNNETVRLAKHDRLLNFTR